MNHPPKLLALAVVVLPTVAALIGISFLLDRNAPVSDSTATWFAAWERLPREAAMRDLRRAAQRIEAPQLLAAALATQREDRLQEARRAFFELLQDIDAEDQAARDQLVLQAAQALQASVAHYGPGGRRVAAELVQQLLIRSADDARVAEQLVLTCESVLKAVEQHHDHVVIYAREVDPSAASPSLGARLKRPHDLKYVPVTGEFRLPPLPGAAEHAVSDKPATPEPVKERPTLKEATAIPTAGQANQPATLDVATQALHASPLIELLKRAQGPQRSEVHRELIRRGLTQRQIEVGENLTSSDPRVRRHAIEGLPRVSGIDAKPWLMWLSHDDDAEVRRAAVTLMATSGEPELMHRLLEMSIGDADSGLRELAERVTHPERQRR